MADNYPFWLWISKDNFLFYGYKISNAKDVIRNANINGNRIFINMR